MHIEHFFDEPTGSLTYLVHDGHYGIVIDPLRDYDNRSGRVSWHSCDRVARVIRDKQLQIPYVIDTHAHADHMTGMPYFKEQFGAFTVTGSGVGVIQSAFRDFYNLGADFPVDGQQFDVLLDEGQELGFGSLEVHALHTPGHTPAHMSWQIGDAVFLGDTLFMPDFGSARCDFPGGSASELYDSVQRIYAMPGDTRLFACHDYLPGGRPLAYQTTVDEQKRSNIQLNANTTKDDYVAFRENRDADLAAPNLLLPSLQVNIRAGDLPDADDNGVTYLRVPINALGANPDRATSSPAANDTAGDAEACAQDHQARAVA